MIDKKVVATFLFIILRTLNFFEAVLDCNDCLEAILKINMLLGIVEVDAILHINTLLDMVEGPKFVFNSNYSWKSFGDAIECNSVLEAIFHWYIVMGILEGPKFVFYSNYTRKYFWFCLRLQWLLRRHSTHAVRHVRRT